MSMDLQSICRKNMVNQIKNLPPVLKEEIIKISIKKIQKEADKKAMKKVLTNVRVVIQDLTSILILSHKSGKDFCRPKYTKKMDDILFDTCLQVSEDFVNTHAETLLFLHRGQLTVNSDEEDEEYNNEYM